MARFAFVCVVALAIASCTFDTTVATGGDPSSDGVAPALDGGVSSPDADPSAPDATLCQSFASAHFDACLIGMPSSGLDLTMPDTYLYNTDEGTLEDPLGALIPHQSVTVNSGGSMTRILSVDSFRLVEGATLRGQGDLPLVVASWGHIEIAGIVDFDSRGSSAGAGANPPQCDTAAATRGENDSSGGGGGGGGGFGGRGGDGGAGDSDESLSAGGSGGSALLQAPAIVRGGCPSAAGGDGLSSGAEGSDGGGAIQLTSSTKIVIRGSIFAGGAGGAGGPTNSRAGGSGGGSGGYIGLQAPTIELSDANLVANGGGGGEGTSSSRTGANGQDSRRSADRANGGDGESDFGTGGGQGGAGTLLDGISVTNSLASGGGGGGGSVGFILLWTPSLANNAALISPPATSL